MMDRKVKVNLGMKFSLGVRTAGPVVGGNPGLECGETANRAPARRGLLFALAVRPGIAEEE